MATQEQIDKQTIAMQLYKNSYPYLTENERYIVEQAYAIKTDAEIAIARKVLAVSGGHVKVRGFTQAKRLWLLTDEMKKIIPDTLGVIEDGQ